MTLWHISLIVKAILTVHLSTELQICQDICIGSLFDVTYIGSDK